MARLSRLSRSIENHVALVTGAASGMGRATAHLFVDEGAHVAVTDLDESRIDSVVAEIVGAGGSANGWVLDVTDRDAVERVVPEIAAHFGGLDVLVNNAGDGWGGAIDDQGYEEEWDRTLDLCLKAQTRMIRAALPWLRKSKAARIVNIASTDAQAGSRFSSPYTSAKHGVVGLTRALAVELGREGITVNCVCPGPILTALTQDIPEQDRVQFAKRRTALGRYGEPEEVAHATLNFALPASQYITGATLMVDGGLTIRSS